LTRSSCEILRVEVPEDVRERAVLDGREVVDCCALSVYLVPETPKKLKDAI
jgi:hypothetical protein